MCNTRSPHKRHVFAIATGALVSFAFAHIALAGSFSMSGLDSTSTVQQYIVKYKDGSAPTVDTSAMARSLDVAAVAVPGKGNLIPLQARHARTMFNGAAVVRTSRALNRVDAETLMRQLAADPNVEYVEPDLILQADVLPDDPLMPSYQWAVGTTSAGINVRPGWERRIDGDGAVVAVLDTGILPHPDLDANVHLSSGYDFVSDPTSANDGDGRDTDATDPGDWRTASDCPGQAARSSTWHGTHVAGTIAAVGHNAIGVTGVAHNASILPVRVLGKCGGTVSDIADAITWVSRGHTNDVPNVPGIPGNFIPVSVINMSLGGRGTCSTTLQSAIDGAIKRGVTVVASAGNDNINVSNSMPANCNGVVAVAATDQSGARASFSNYGTGVTISAPGVSILSTGNGGTSTASGNAYTYMSGTSMAAPHVSGVIALMQSLRTNNLSPDNDKLPSPDNLSPAQVTEILRSTARPLPGSCSGGCGAGIVDATAAALAAWPTGIRKLTRGVPLTGVSGGSNELLYFSVDVPANARNLKIYPAGADIAGSFTVKYAVPPRRGIWAMDSSADCTASSTGGTCTFSQPNEGTYYVLVKKYGGFSNASIHASYTRD